MKLLFCKGCQDIVKIGFSTKTCMCSMSKAKLVSETEAMYTGKDAYIIHIENSELREAIINQPETGEGNAFRSLVMAKFSLTNEQVSLKDYK